MKVGTRNKLAHYQCEYQELTEQTAMLQSQVAPLQVQVAQLQQYCSVNSGDRSQMASLRQHIQRLNTLVNTIRRNQMRLRTLENQINTESNRIMLQQRKLELRMMNGNRGYGRRNVYY